MIKVKYLSVGKTFIVVACALVSFQNNALADDLMQLYQTARSHDAQYAAAQSTWAATQEKSPQANALLKPQVSASASAMYNSIDTTYKGATAFPGGRQNFNSTAYGITLRQALYNKQDWEQMKQSSLQLRQSDAQLKNSEQDLILRIAQAYFDVLAAKDNLSFSALQKQAIEKQLQQAQRKFEVGSNTQTDVLEAQARYDLVLADEVAAKNAVLIKNRALSRIIGTSVPPLASLEANWRPSPPDPVDEAKWLQRASQSPAVVIQQAGYQIAEKEIEKQRADFYPSLDLVANYQQESANGSAIFGTGIDSRTGNIGVQLSVPIYSGGSASSRTREAEHSKEASRYQLEEAERDAQFNTSQSYLGVMSGIAQVTALNQAVVSNQNLLKSSQRGWQLGTRTAVDVLNAQQQLYGAKRDLQQARYNALMSELQLSASVGQLTEADLKKVNALLVTQ